MTDVNEGDCRASVGEITVKKIQKSWINSGVYDMIKKQKGGFAEGIESLKQMDDELEKK